MENNTQPKSRVEEVIERTIEENDIERLVALCDFTNYHEYDQYEVKEKEYKILSSLNPKSREEPFILGFVSLEQEMPIFIPLSHSFTFMQREEQTRHKRILYVADMSNHLILGDDFVNFLQEAKANNQIILLITHIGYGNIHIEKRLMGNTRTKAIYQIGGYEND